MKKWMFIVFLIALVILWQSIVFFDRMTNPMEEAKTRAIEMAKKEFPLNKIEDVTFFNGEEPYQIIYARNDKNEEIILWVPEKNNENILMKKASEGWNKSQVKEFAHNELDMKKLKNIRLGIKNKIPAWEITFIDHNDRYGFFYLRFDGQTWIENYRLKM